MTSTGQHVAPGRSSTAWIWFLLGGTVTIAVYYLMPAFGAPAIAREVVARLFPIAAVLGLLVGIFVYRPAKRLPWYLLAGAQLLNLTGDIVNFLQSEVFHTDQYPSPADLCYLAAYPMIGVALVMFVRRRTPGSHMSAVLDASVVSLSLGMLWWVYLVRPLTVQEGKPLEVIVNVAYPAMDLLLIVVAARLALGVGARTVAYRLLVGSLLATLLTDAVYAILTARNIYGDNDTWLEWGWLVAYLLMGASALHPSMRSLDRRAARAPRGASGRRVAALAVAGVLPSVVLAVQYLVGSDLSVLSVAVASVALFLLVLVRLQASAGVQRQLAIRDELTGLHTRRFLDETLGIECRRARMSGTELGVLLIDVDNLRLVDDTYGQQAGDVVLAAVAGRLHEASRPGDLVARYRSDEFVVLVPWTEMRETALLSERLRDAVCEDRITVGDDTAVRVTVSIGIARMPGDGRTAEELLYAADQALHAAKRSGRNRTFTRHGPVNVVAFGGLNPAVYGTATFAGHGSEARA